MTPQNWECQHIRTRPSKPRPSPSDAFEQILASLHEAMLDEDHWFATSALIDEACRAKGNHLAFSYQLPEGDVEFLFTRFCYRGEHRTDREQEYFRTYFPVDVHLPQLRQLPDSRIVHVTETFSELDRKKSVMFNEAMPRFEFQNGLNVRLDGPKGSRIIFGIADPVDSNGWSSDQFDMVARLLPHIRQFVRVRHALIESGALKTTLSQLLENTNAGVIQLDRHGRIVAANDRAQELLRNRDVLSDEDGVLCASSPNDDTALQELLARALPSFGARGRSGSMVVRAKYGTPPSMVLHVTPVEDRQLDLRTWRAAALVLAVDPRRPCAHRPARAARDTPPDACGERSRCPSCRGPFRQRHRENGSWSAHGALARQAEPEQGRSIPPGGSRADRAGDRRTAPGRAEGRMSRCSGSRSPSHGTGVA